MALTGAARPSECGAITGSTSVACGGALSLQGPSSVADGGSNPRFVATNDSDRVVRVHSAGWGVYRRTDGWERVATGSGGDAVALEPGEATAWVLLLGDDAAQSMTATSTTTRYVGPVSLQPAEYAFVATGERNGETVEAVARFDVTR